MKIIPEKIFVLPVIIFFLFVFAGCEYSSNSIVVYTTVDQVFSEPVLKKFEEQTDI